MADAYASWLIPRGSTFAPSAAGVAKLIERLRAERWIADPTALQGLRFEGARAGRAAKTGGYGVWTIDRDPSLDPAAQLLAGTAALPAAPTASWLDDGSRDELRLVWPVDADDPLPVRYPLSLRPAGRVAYSLEVHRSTDYVVPLGDGITLPPTRCACGEDLSFEWDEDEVVPAFERSGGIFAVCEACARPFDPSRGSATVAGPLGGPTQELRGGTAHRFALKVDCGARFVPSPELAFAPELVASLEDEFGRAFVQLAVLRR